MSNPLNIYHPYSRSQFPSKLQSSLEPCAKEKFQTSWKVQFSPELAWHRFERIQILNRGKFINLTRPVQQSRSTHLCKQVKRPTHLLMSEQRNILCHLSWHGDFVFAAPTRNAQLKTNSPCRSPLPSSCGLLLEFFLLNPLSFSKDQQKLDANGARTQSRAARILRGQASWGHSMGRKESPARHQGGTEGDNRISLLGKNCFWIRFHFLCHYC